MSTKQCSPVAKIIPLSVDLYHLTELSNKIEKHKEERKALYKEEHNLLQKEPEYFPEENADFTDHAELLPEEYGYSGNEEITSNKSLPEGHDADYPEFPSIEDDQDYDYSEFKNTTHDLIDVDETEEYEDRTRMSVPLKI